MPKPSAPGVLPLFDGVNLVADRGVGIGVGLDHVAAGRFHVAGGLPKLRTVGGGDLLQVGQGVGLAVRPRQRDRLGRQRRQLGKQPLDLPLLGRRLLGQFQPPGLRAGNLRGNVQVEPRLGRRRLIGRGSRLEISDGLGVSSRRWG